MTLVVLLWSFLHWGLDPLLRYSAVQTLQTVTGARADIGSLSTQIYPPRLHLNQVALADANRPGTNLVEFDELEFRLAGHPLMNRRFVVEEARLTGVKFRTRRQDDGQLEESTTKEESESSPWINDKLKEFGDEWMTQLTDQAMAQLRPEVLETFRTGNAVYEKWDVRFREMKDRTQLLKPRFRELQSSFENARHGDALQQLEQYLQVAEKADKLSAEAKQLQAELTGIVPEVREDFRSLDRARRNDQQMVMQKVSMLRPDGRRISEALIGEQMYLRLQELMSWIETARRYQQELHAQVKPERGPGQDFVFPVQNPTPDFLLQRLFVSGELEIEGEAVPFDAELTDLTEDPRLLGRPCVVHLQTADKKSLQLRLSVDATGSTIVTDLGMDVRNRDGILLSAGKPDQSMLSGRISDVAWKVNLQLADDQLRGDIHLNSRLDDTVFATSQKVRPELLQAANEAISSVRSLSADLYVGGTLKDPTLELESTVGEQLAEGMQQAFVQQMEKAKQRLVSEVNSFATDQVSRLSARFATEFDQLEAENKALLSQVREVQAVVASVQSGKLDAGTMMRQVKSSRALPPETRQQIDKAAQGMNRVLDQTRMSEALKGVTLPGGPRRQ